MELINISISLDKIDKERIVVSNGKKFLNLTLIERKEESKYGETHSLAHQKTKEEVQRSKDGEVIDLIFIGSGKRVDFKRPLTKEEEEDLPF